MPKLGGMAQLSRPFQIVLLAALALAMLMVTFMVLHRSGGTASSGGSSPSVASSAGSSASHAATHAAASGAGSGHVYHGAVPGLEGLTRDIKRAHEAAGKSERGVGYQEAHAGQTSSASASTTGGSRAQTHASTSSSAASAHHAAATAKTNPDASATAKTHPGASAATPSHAKTHGPHAAATAGATAALTLHHLTEAVHLKAVLSLLDPALKAKVAAGEGVFIHAMTSYLQPASQATVAAELKHGKTVLLLFLNPKAYDDDAVAIETVTVARKLGHSLAVHYALASQVNSFGSITREIQVYQTPTLLIVNSKRQVTTLTGLTDHYAVEQAIAEARGKTFNAPGQA